ncbi:ABC transporter substrate-binding protein [Bosea vaviloviae]|uniref:Peptide ABC transporter substrate-binding protein n=1 Tax=Bosea vaviloviae TaxID=1526658 RepID=A0A1D7U4E8_9HYPH|nr:ABC transporter substrate-binding protein [Bosea vaviloviae]AOO82256.1 peptide ABC transporter substrate-binding protein [Bosea vaviloviae]
MRKNALAITLYAATLSTAAFAQTAGSKTIRVIDYWSVRTGWEMGSDDSYLASRAGCYEGLARVDYDNKLQPSLATSWTQTSPTTWEFTLRDNVKFQDGQPLNAAAASNALNNLLKAAVPAKAFSPKMIKSVEAVGDQVVKITTVEPSMLLPLQMASPATSILSPAAYKDGKVNPVNTCTGPFIMTEVDPAQRIIVKRNDGYWGGKPVLAGAEIRFILDPNSRAMQIRTGEADLVRLIPPLVVGRVKSTSGVKIEQLNGPRTTMLLLNNKKAPLDNVKVRQAIQAAIDTAGLAGAVYEGAVQPAVGPFVSTDPWALKGAKPPYDLKKAQALLAEAGIKPGTLKLNLIAYTNRAEFKDVAAVIQDQLKAIGIEVNVRSAEYNAVEPDMLSGNYDMALMSRGYLTDAAEPASYLNADYACGGSYNISHYCTPEMDEKLKGLFNIKEPAARAAAYRDIAQSIQSQALTVFLINETAYDAYNAKVNNYKTHPLNYYTLTPTLSIN